MVTYNASFEVIVFLAITQRNRCFLTIIYAEAVGSRMKRRPPNYFSCHRDDGGLCLVPFFDIVVDIDLDEAIDR